MSDDFIALAKLCGAVDYTPPPMRAIRGVAFTYAQLDQFIDKVIRDNTDRSDTELMDFLADKSQDIANVMLPRECVVHHVDSLRDAIRDAMRMHQQAAAAAGVREGQKP